MPTKQEIKDAQEKIIKLQKEIRELENILISASECQECGEFSENCQDVVWYPETEDRTVLTTCPDCIKIFAQYIKID